MAEGVWLPEGVHYDLHIERRPLESAGSFTGGGNKWVWHTTESDWFSVDAMFGVLRDKRAAPHFVIGGRRGLKLPVVIQMLPFDEAGRALANDADPFATNRANAIQTEICARASLVGKQLTEWHYKALANLVRQTNERAAHSHDVPRKLARSFADTRRFSDREFVAVSGHLGHMHVPDNDHVDPGTGFRGSHLIHLLEQFPRGGYNLA